MYYYESMQYLNIVYFERYYVVKNVDDRMKYENVGKYMYMIFLYNFERKKYVI